MDNIIFRAFNTHDKEMYGNEVALQLLYKDSIGEKYDRKKWKIMQFSGVPDKNKKNMCVGDKIKLTSDLYDWIFYGEIKYGDTGRFYADCPGYVPDLVHPNHIYEVIGNIYQ